jgi:small subunit ribosomal protein S1
VHHVQTAADLRSEWFAGAQTAGITAGTSTPDAVINGVELWLKELEVSAATPKIQTREKHVLAFHVA